MKDFNQKYNALSLLSTIGLVALLLLSPCKVRNSIQAALDVEQTEVSNKSVSTINGSCTSYDDAVINSDSRSNYISFLADNNSSFATVKTTNFLKNHFPTDELNVFSRSDIPLYILYQNFKVYL